MAEIKYISKREKLKTYIRGIFKKKGKIEKRACIAMIELETSSSEKQVNRMLENMLIVGEIGDVDGFYIHKDYYDLSEKKSPEEEAEEVLEAKP